MKYFILLISLIFILGFISAKEANVETNTIRNELNKKEKQENKLEEIKEWISLEHDIKDNIKLGICIIDTSDDFRYRLFTNNKNVRLDFINKLKVLGYKVQEVNDIVYRSTYYKISWCNK